ncbi:MAG: flagellar hook-associated protein FlgL [Anaerolineae bacterium]|nr:flagellar hook-associated protein FlgL [Anaerolineae bacterium]
MRITHKMLDQTAVEGMQANMRRLADIQKQAVTTKRVSRPEDDPFAVEQSLGFRARLQNGEAILHNVSMSSDWLNATDRTLSDMNMLLMRSQNLALQGSNEAMGPDERQSLASEVEGILEEAVALGNTRHGDNYIFAGFQVDQPAFTTNRDATTGLITSVAYEGDSGQIMREIEPGINMGVNVLGDQAFAGIYDTLIRLRDALKASPFIVGDVASKVTDIQNQASSLSDLQAAVGTKLRRLENTADRVEAAQIGLQELLSKAEDADMAEVISQLNQQQFAYQAALQVNARTLNMSLLDFLK